MGSNGVFNVTPGNYTVIARLVATPACVSGPSTGVTVNAPTAAPAAPAISVTSQPSCGQTTGTVTVNPTDPTLEYSIDGGTTWVGSGIFNNVAVGGPYTVIARVIATPACVSAASASVTVNAPTTVPATPLITVTQPSCGQTTGTVSVTAPDGTLEYSIDGGTTWAGSGIFNNVAVGGPYTVIARSVATPACVSAASASVTVNAPTTVPATPLITVTQPSCGQTTGTVSVTAPDGTLEYSIDGGTTWAGSGIFNNVAVGGPYTVIARSVATPACVSAASASVTVNAPTTVPATPLITVTQPSCGQTTGTVSVTAPDGTLEYSIDGGTTWVGSGIFNNVPVGGPYSVIARSVATPACVSAASASVTVNAPTTVPATPLITVTQPSCGQTTGTVSVTA